jgi:hypothetical protein
MVAHGQFFSLCIFLVFQDNQFIEHISSYLCHIHLRKTHLRSVFILLLHLLDGHVTDVNVFDRLKADIVHVRTELGVAAANDKDLV